MRKFVTPLAVLLAASTSTAAFGQSASISGVYSSTEGQLSFIQRGQSLTGSYPGGGQLTGTVSGKRLRGFWVKPNARQRCSTAVNGSYYWGRIDFTFVSGDAFQGQWSYCDDPVSASSRAWNGSLQQIASAGTPKVAPGPVAPGPNFDGVGVALSAPCATTTGAVANVGPCSTTVGSTLTVRQLQPAAKPFGSLVFRTTPAKSTPATITVPLTGGKSVFNAVVPAQLCTRGSPAWDVELVTASGENQGVIGRFTPDCR